MNERRDDPDAPAGGAPDVDPGKPSTARIYDYFLGGKDNFEVDRAAADQLTAVLPEAPLLARANRSFLIRAVRCLAELGVDQYIDLGAGIPTSPNVHEVARETNPAAKAVYVDNDPAVVAHSRALRSNPGGVVSVELDIRDAARLAEHRDVRELIDFSRPVAVLLLAVLHFHDNDDARKIIDGIRSWLAPGGYLVLSTGGAEKLASQAAQARAIYAKAGAQAVGRTREDIRELLHDFEFLTPGVTPITKWRADHPDTPNSFLLGGVARRTA